MRFAIQRHPRPPEYPRRLRPDLAPLQRRIYYMSPVHAQLALRDGRLFLRDLGSRNGTWLDASEPYKLQDGDSILIGSQIIRFRRLGYPGPNPPEADATRRLGSAVPSADVAVLQQLRADGSARDSCHLSPARSVVVGRTEGDWLFPYDQTMSGRHAEIRREDLDFIMIDLGSRNGVAVAVRGERPVKAGQKILRSSGWRACERPESLSYLPYRVSPQRTLLPA